MLKLFWLFIKHLAKIYWRGAFGNKTEKEALLDNELPGLLRLGPPENPFLALIKRSQTKEILYPNFCYNEKVVTIIKEESPP